MLPKFPHFLWLPFSFFIVFCCFAFSLVLRFLLLPLSVIYNFVFFFSTFHLFCFLSYSIFYVIFRFFSVFFRSYSFRTSHFLLSSVFYCLHFRLLIRVKISSFICLFILYSLCYACFIYHVSHMWHLLKWNRMRDCVRMRVRMNWRPTDSERQTDRHIRIVSQANEIWHRRW